MGWLWVYIYSWYMGSTRGWGRKNLLLSTWMAPLRPSADIPHVGTQKDIYGLRFSQNTIDELLINDIHYPSSGLLFLFRYVKTYPQPYPYATRGSSTSVGVCKSRMDVSAGCSYGKLRIIHEFYFFIPKDAYLWYLKIKHTILWY